jgi:hypothetical protein
VPGAPAPFTDTWAPAQYVYGSSGGAGPVRSPGSGTGIVTSASGDAALNPQTQSTFDGTLHLKLAGTIILALVGVFILQAMGFRFVVAVGG